MANEIRFAQLVKKSGEPETLTLWTEPEKNPDFMKAVRQNRVLTVIQRPAAHHKDFGTIGFLKENHALYFLFPKPLPKEPNAQVVGIKYDLLQKEQPTTPVRKTGTKHLKISDESPAQRKQHPRESPNGKPPTVFQPSVTRSKTFRVKVRRTASLETEVTVEAENFHQAEQNALQAVNEQEFQPEGTNDEVKSIMEI